MKVHRHYNHHIFIITLVLCSYIVHTTYSESRIQDLAANGEIHRRILHQPLYPVTSAPPPESVSPPPPPPDSPDQPFFPEVPTVPNSDQSPPPPVPTNGSIPIPTATQPAKPTKKVAIAISVGIVTLGMLSALAFFLYKHRARHPGETQKLVGGNSSQRLPDESRVPPSTFLYIGTVEPANRRSVAETNGENGVSGSPYHKLNSIKRSDRYRPSPELQPLPPLAKTSSRNSVSAMSSSDEDSQDMSFYTPQGSLVSSEEGNYTPASRRNNQANNHSLLKPTRVENNHHATISVPHSKRTSPRARLSASSPDMKLAMIPSIKQASPPPPPPQAQPRVNQVENNKLTIQIPPQRPKFAAAPPPPNMALLQAISKQSPPKSNKQVPPPPPPPPPLFTPRKLIQSKSKNCATPSQVTVKQLSETPTSKTITAIESSSPVEEVNRSGNSLERLDSDDMEGGKAKLKPLHWDKVRATSDRATVWDQLKSSSFQLNEDMMETLFGCNSANSVQKEATRKSVLPPVEHENRVLDPKKSQNIAILLRALNVTRDEVSDALLDGNPESLGAELLETLVKMAPTKEEEIKLREYNGDTSKLGSAERFLKSVLDIPFAFKRVEAMLYRANFDAEVKYLKKSFQALEEASEELRNSRLFLKLLEAVLRTGNRMNVGTNRGDARAFKLDTLLKLVDIKGTDGKTTLLHFVVQEIIRSEGADSDATNENLQNNMNSKMKDGDFNKHGLQVVAGLSRDLGNVKKAAGMDSDVLSSYVSKLEMGLDKVRLILQYERPNVQGRFFDSMKSFLKEAEDEIVRIKSNERKALSMVKEVTKYFHGDTAKEEAHPLRIFMIVRDFLFVLDRVCKEVGNMQDRAIVGAARSFRISASASLPVLNRFNVRQDSSDEESLSP